VRSLGLALLVGVVPACIEGGLATYSIEDASTSDGGPRSDDASGDGSDDLVEGDVCGPAPWVNVSITVNGASVTNQTGTPLQGAEFTSPLCPNSKKVSDANGIIAGKISQGVPFYARLVAKNFIPMLVPEMQFDKDTSGVTVVMPPAAVEYLLPDAGAPNTWILIGALHDGGSGACDQFDGISFNVPNHPEAIVTYYTADLVPQPIPGGTATTSGGRATIVGLAPNPAVTVTATKPGCVVTSTKAPLTGKVPLEAGFISLMPAYVSNLPDGGDGG
jgi:hypothetical protein